MAFSKSQIVGLILTTTMAAIVSPLSAQERKPHKYALLVGVKNYIPGELDNLNYTENDAEEMGKTLEGLGFDRVMVLTQKRGAEKPELGPSSDNILEHLKSLIEECKPDDWIVVGFSGHGMQLKIDGKEEAYFCPADARLNKQKNLIRLSDVYKQLADGPVGVKVLVVDACRNDPKGKGKAVNAAEFEPEAPPRGVMALFSCSRQQKSFESDEFKHGIFFHYVIEGLKGGAANKNGEVTLSALEEYLVEQVPRRTKQENSSLVKQVPSHVGEFSGKLVLAKVNLSGMNQEIIEEFEWNKVRRARRVLKLDLGGRERIDFVRIKSGTFLMGSPESDPDAEADEKPQHEVAISRDFYFGKFHVTKGQFARFVEETGYKTDAERDGAGGWGYVPEKEDGDGPLFDSQTGQRNGGANTNFSWRNAGFSQTDRHPVVNVSWNDAKAFCGWLSKKTGRRVELPTEAQYEYACRGGTTTRYFSGDGAESLNGFANIADASLKVRWTTWQTVTFDDGFMFTSPVGRFEPNGFGLYDIIGNVCSWCDDFYVRYSDGRVIDPKAITRTNHFAHILRGGGWSGKPSECRCAFRGRAAPLWRTFFDGFRVVIYLD